MAKEQPLAILPRDSWIALPPKAVVQLLHPVPFVFCMNTNTHPCTNEYQCQGTLRQLQQHHLNRQRHRDIRYNFIIGGDGNVYEGRGWMHQGLLPEKYREYNDKSIVIGFVGEHTEADLPDIMTQRRNELVSYGVQQNYILPEFQPYEIFERKQFLNTI